MGKDVYLVIWGAIAGLFSAVVLEYVKHRLEQKRTALLKAQDRFNQRSEQLTEFLRGENSAALAETAPGPAWLRQVSVARRHPLARLGLRSDEDYSTDAYPIDRRSSIRNTKTLLKTFGKGRTRSKRPSKNKGGKFLLSSSHLIGRGSSCDIQVLDPAVSLIHCLIRFEESQYRLYDLGSTTGTFVDGRLVRAGGTSLLGGEIIRMGNTLFEFGSVVKGGEPDQADPFLVI